MKQNLILYVFLLIGLCGCGTDTTNVKIKGEIKGFEKDTIYLYGNDEFADFIKPIPVTNTEFSLEMALDTTFVQAMLFISDQEQYPIYLERGKTIHIKGDVNIPGILDVKGSPVNEELTAFVRSLPQPINQTDTITRRLAETYINRNQKSPINIYLLDKYFVQSPSPDFGKIKQLIGIMDGALQDKPYIEKLTEMIDEDEKAAVDKMAPSFTLTNPEGKRISRGDFRDKYLLINFWASWCDSCQTYNKELKEIYKAHPPKKQNSNKKPSTPAIPELSLLSISLDMDKAAWKDAIKRDTLKWEQVSDFSGWGSPVIKQYAIREIPYNVLLDNRGKIIARGINGEELKQKLGELLKQNK